MSTEEEEIHADVRKAMRGGVRTLTGLLKNQDPKILKQTINALEKMVGDEYNETFATMDGYNSTLKLLCSNIAKENPEVLSKVINFISRLPAPSKLDIDTKLISPVGTLVTVQTDAEIKSKLTSVLGTLCTYEDWSTGIKTRQECYQNFVKQLKEDPNKNYALMGVLAKICSKDPTMFLDEAQSQVFIEVFNASGEEQKLAIIPSLTFIYRSVGKAKFPLKSIAAELVKVLKVATDDTKKSVVQLFEEMARHGVAEVEPAISPLLSLINTPPYTAQAISLLLTFTVDKGCIVAVYGAGGVKILLEALKSGKLDPNDANEARSLLGRIIQDSENKVKIVEQGMLAEILTAIGEETGGIMAELSFEAFVEQGNLSLDIAKQLLSSGVDPSTNGNKPLAMACGRGMKGLVGLLLSDKRVDPGAGNQKALRLAARNGHADIIQLLLEDSRVDPTIENNAAIRTACEHGHLEAFKALKSHPGVSLNGLLLPAITGGNIEIAEELLKDDPSGGIAPGENVPVERDPLQAAIEINHSPLVRLIFTATITNPAANDNRAIRWAAKHGHADIVELLLEDSLIDPTANDHEAIKSAVAGGWTDTVQKLLNDGRSDPALENNLLIRVASKKGYVDIVSLLLVDPRVDPSALNNEAIRLASANGHVEVVDTLLTHDLVDPSDCGNQAMIDAANAGHSEIVRYLMMDQRVDPSARYNAALKSACLANHVEVVALLLRDERVDPSVGLFDVVKEALDDETVEDSHQLWKRFAIRFATGHNQPKIAEMLESDPRASPVFLWNYAVKNGITDFVKLLSNDRRIEDTHIKMAFEIASKKGHFGIMELLLQAEQCDITLKEVGKSIATGFSEMRRRMQLLEDDIVDLATGQEQVKAKLDAILDLLIAKAVEDGTSGKPDG